MLSNFSSYVGILVIYLYYFQPSVQSHPQVVPSSVHLNMMTYQVLDTRAKQQFCRTRKTPFFEITHFAWPTAHSDILKNNFTSSRRWEAISPIQYVTYHVLICRKSIYCSLYSLLCHDLLPFISLMLSVNMKTLFETTKSVAWHCHKTFTAYSFSMMEV